MSCQIKKKDPQPYGPVAERAAELSNLRNRLNDAASRAHHAAHGTCHPTMTARALRSLIVEVDEVTDGLHRFAFPGDEEYGRLLAVSVAIEHARAGRGALAGEVLVDAFASEQAVA